jgi:GntR family transcriptional regulator
MSKFEKLAADIRRQIQTGQLQPGDRLLSISQLRKKHRVSYGTIRSAMLVLKAEKLIVGRPGEAVYVRGENDRMPADD